MSKILIADDNPDIIDVLSVYVEKEGYEPVTAENGEQAYLRFLNDDPVCVLLDVMMPKMDGYEVCKKIRAKSDIPVILITARGEDYERIMGLDIGADDYIVKPFSPSEVMARVRAVLRRLNKGDNSEKASICKVGNLEINLDQYRCKIGEEEIKLTKKEIETVWVLASNPGKVFSRDMLLDRLWGADYDGDSRTVDSHIKRLRAKLDKSTVPHEGWAISTVWAAGYKFDKV